MRAWWVQRVSAVCMLLFILFVLAALGLRPKSDYPQWKAWIARPGISLAFLVFMAALLAHMWVGLRDVLLDYARPAAVRNGLLVAVALYLAGIGAWMLFILLRLHI
jgi:succinate dehydrogenase / fumarate reductase, membrane anchor subunit